MGDSGVIKRNRHKAEYIRNIKMLTTAGGAYESVYLLGRLREPREPKSMRILVNGSGTLYFGCW